MSDQLGVSRRNLICGFVAAGVAVPLVAACGGSEPSAASTSTGAPTTGGATTGAPTTAPTTAGAAADAIPTSEIPVGGGKIFPDRALIVTQPTAGEFKAFSNACTHQGTAINNISDGRMICPLHGSQFSVVDGSNLQGPSGSAAGSVQPLTEKTVTVKGATLTVS